MGPSIIALAVFLALVSDNAACVVKSPLFSRLVAAGIIGVGEDKGDADAAGIPGVEW